MTFSSIEEDNHGSFILLREWKLYFDQKERMKTILTIIISISRRSVNATSHPIESLYTCATLFFLISTYICLAQKYIYPMWKKSHAKVSSWLVHVWCSWLMCAYLNIKMCFYDVYRNYCLFIRTFMDISVNGMWQQLTFQN